MKRYGSEDGDMICCDVDGDWVAYEDADELERENTRLKELTREMVAAMEMVVRNHSEVDWTLPIAIVLWIKTVLAKAEGAD